FPARTTIRGSEERAPRVACDDQLVVEWIHGEREQRRSRLVRQRTKSDPRRIRLRGDDHRRSRDRNHPKRHDRRKKTLAKQRHESADYHLMRHWDQPTAGLVRGPFAYNPQVLSRGQRELKARAPGSWIKKAGAWLDRAAFKPATLPDDLVTAVALIPPIAAGLIIFKLPALQLLAIAAAVGTPGLLAARVFMRGEARHPGISVLLAPLFGVSLVGPGAGFIVTIEVAVLAVVVGFLRAQYLSQLPRTP